MPIPAIARPCTNWSAKAEDQYCDFGRSRFVAEIPDRGICGSLPFRKNFAAVQILVILLTR
jgi:hypothetical protein